MSEVNSHQGPSEAVSELTERYAELRQPAKKLIGSVTNQEQKDELMHKFMKETPFFAKKGD